MEDNFSANSSPTKETPRLQTMNGYAGTNGWSPGGAKHEGLKDPTSRGLDRSSSTEGYTDPFEDNQRTVRVCFAQKLFHLMELLPSHQPNGLSK